MIDFRQKYGFTGFSLKMTAVFCMTLDHIYYYLSGIYNIPVIFNIIGRITAPIFIFMVSEGFYHSKNRFKYLSRLYIASVLMAYANYFIQNAIKPVNGKTIVNHIFGTMFLIGWFIYFIDIFKVKIKQRKIAESIFSFSMLLIPVLWSFIVMVVILNKDEIQSPLFVNIFTKAMILFPDIITAEGSIFAITMGVSFYYFRKFHLGSETVLFVSSLMLFVMASFSGINFKNLLYLNNDFLFILALPFIYLYNGKKGRSMKYFFYLYYPLHAYFLYILSHILAK